MDCQPGLISKYVATPYESTIDWKTEVNLLVLLYVGGACEVSMRFRIEGTLLPLRSLSFTKYPLFLTSLNHSLRDFLKFKHIGDDCRRILKNLY